MLRKSVRVAVGVFTAISLFGPVSADSLSDNSIILAKDKLSLELPPLDYAGSRWATTDGCVYSRAGRPGETVWYLIINRSARRDCRRLITSSAYEDGAYQGYRS